MCGFRCWLGGERRRRKENKNRRRSHSPYGSAAVILYTFFHNYLLARLYFFIAVHNWRKRAIKWCVLKAQKKARGHKTRAAAAAAKNFFDACWWIFLQIYCVHLSRSDAQSRKAALLNNIQLPSSFCACYFIVSSPFLIFYANYREDWTWPLFSYTIRATPKSLDRRLCVRALFLHGGRTTNGLVTSGTLFSFIPIPR